MNEYFAFSDNMGITLCVGNVVTSSWEEKHLIIISKYKTFNIFTTYLKCNFFFLYIDSWQFLHWGYCSFFVATDH